MIRFGAAGNSDSFYEEGNKSTVQTPAWLSGRGLDALEYSAGHGINMSESTASAICTEARNHGIAMSLHAPYYISCGTSDPAKHEKTLQYLLSSAMLCNQLGGTRVVFHPGYPSGAPRNEALARMEDTVMEALALLEENDLGNIHLCPETMGQPGQLGSLEEILHLCKKDKRLLPTIDFAHLHSAGQGCLTSTEDFRRILDRLLETLDEQQSHSFHVHFSHIAYGPKGEKRHVCFRDEGYGPDFALLAPLLYEYSMEPVIICESAGTQAEDAAAMKDMYFSCAQ